MLFNMWHLYNVDKTSDDGIQSVWWMTAKECNLNIDHWFLSNRCWLATDKALQLQRWVCHVIDQTGS